MSMSSPCFASRQPTHTEIGGILIRGRLRFGSRRAARAGGVRNRAASGQQAGLAGLDLQAEILGVDAALGETAGDEPEARLSGAHEHVAQFLAIAKTPDRADTRGNI